MCAQLRPHYVEKGGPGWCWGPREQSTTEPGIETEMLPLSGQENIALTQHMAGLTSSPRYLILRNTFFSWEYTRLVFLWVLDEKKKKHCL